MKEFTSADVPPGSRFRDRQYPGVEFSPVQLDRGGIHIYNGSNPCHFKHLKWETLRGYYEILRPGSTVWERCERPA